MPTLCPLCAAQGAVIAEEAPALTVHCARCGDFSITRAAAAMWKLSGGSAQSSALLFAWKHLLQSRRSGHFPALTLSFIETCIAWGERAADSGT
jgi:hypothetical protein